MSRHAVYLDEPRCTAAVEVRLGTQTQHTDLLSAGLPHSKVEQCNSTTAANSHALMLVVMTETDARLRCACTATYLATCTIVKLRFVPNSAQLATLLVPDGQSQTPVMC